MRQPEQIKVFIVDDHQIVIDGLVSLLDNEPEFCIAGSTNKPEEVSGLLQRHDCDVLITDVQMPGMTGVELTRIVRRQFPHVYVLALSMFGDIDTIIQMQESGISGYILKNTGKQELLMALKEVAAGKQWLSPELAKEMARRARQDSSDVAALTSREIEIVKLIAQDMSNKQIAQELFISERTVETHRKNALRKTGTQSAVSLINYARKHSII